MKSRICSRRQTRCLTLLFLCWAAIPWSGRLKAATVGVRVQGVVFTSGTMAPASPLDNPIKPRIRRAGSRVKLISIAEGLSAPNWGISAPGNAAHLFVADQMGILWAIDLASGQKRVFADLRAWVVLPPLGERGLLGLAFHPAYENNGLLYTFTSEPVGGAADFSPSLPEYRQTIRA